jgi:Tfp pilus assembly protein PilN
VALDSIDFDQLLEDEAAEAEAEAGQSASRQSGPLVQWLIVLGLALGIVPLYLLSSTVKAETTSLQTRLDELQEQLVGAPEMPADAEQLEGDIAMLQEQAAELDNLWIALANRHIDWPDVLPTITTYDPELVRLTGMTQSENRILIAGQARHEAAALAYADQLESSGQFAHVSMQSMTVLGPADVPAEDDEDAAATDAPEWVSAQGAVTVTILVEMETVLP